MHAHIIFYYCFEIKDKKYKDNKDRENKSFYILCFKSIKIHSKII